MFVNVIRHISHCDICAKDYYLAEKLKAYDEETYDLHIPMRRNEISATVAELHAIEAAIEAIKC